MAPVVDHETGALVEDSVAAWVFALEVQYVLLFLSVPLLHFFKRFCRYWQQAGISQFLWRTIFKSWLESLTLLLTPSFRIGIESLLRQRLFLSAGLLLCARNLLFACWVLCFCTLGSLITFLDRLVLLCRNWTLRLVVWSILSVCSLLIRIGFAIGRIIAFIENLGINIFWLKCRVQILAKIKNWQDFFCRGSGEDRESTILPLEQFAKILKVSTQLEI